MFRSENLKLAGLQRPPGCTRGVFTNTEPSPTPGDLTLALGGGLKHHGFLQSSPGGSQAAMAQKHQADLVAQSL